MIDRDILAEAARYNDAQAEELGVEGWARVNQIDLEGLRYIAEQRAMRIVMLQRQQDAGKYGLGIDPTKKVALSFTDKENTFIRNYTLAVLDGIAIGVKAERLQNGSA